VWGAQVAPHALHFRRHGVNMKKKSNAAIYTIMDGIETIRRTTKFKRGYYRVKLTETEWKMFKEAYTILANMKGFVEANRR
jgi:hypothetical protein